MKEVTKESAEIQDKKQEGPLSSHIELFKHESYTDGGLVYIDVMSPVKVSGTGKVSVDKDRVKQFIGKSQVDFGGRVMPYTFIIENVTNIKQAIDIFEEAMDTALERTREQVEEAQKEKEAEENKIIVPNEKQGIIV